MPTFRQPDPHSIFQSFRPSVTTRKLSAANSARRFSMVGFLIFFSFLQAAIRSSIQSVTATKKTLDGVLHCIT